MLLKLSRLFVYAALMSVTIVLSSTFFPFIGGKYFFFRVMVEAALGAFLLYWAFEGTPDAERRVRNVFRRPLVLAVTLFAFLFLLSSLFAHDPHAAFWSNYERGDGAFQMLHYYAFFLLLVLLFESESEWRRALLVAVAAGVGMILYGAGAAALTQNAGGGYSSPFGFIGPYLLSDGQPTAGTFLGRVFTQNNRFQGSLGNPAYVAPYLLFTIFYLLYLWRGMSGSGLGNRKTLRIILFGLALAFFLVFFFLSQTRGAFLGLGAGVLAFLLSIVISSPSLRRKAGIALGVLALLLGLFYVNREQPMLKQVFSSRLFSVSLQEDSIQTRFWTWGSAWQGFKERPILGWGPENFSTVFDKYFDPRHYVPGKNTETWFDRAHSVFFDYLTETGILGLLSFVGMFAVFYFQLFGVMKGKPEEGRVPFAFSPTARGLLLALPLAYLVQGLVLFDVLPMYINLFFFFAFASAALPSHSSPTYKGSVLSKPEKIL